MLNIDLENVEEAAEFKKVIPGGYVARITTVEDVQNREFLKIEYDIVEGDFAGYYADLFDSKGFWGGSFIKSYKEKALPFFKGFITAVEASNKGYKWNNDETKLNGRLVGIVLGEEAYKKNDGTLNTRLYVDKLISVDDVKKGNFVIPQFKGEKPSSNSFTGDDMTPIDDGDIPF